MEILAFALIAFGVIAIPGPNVLVVASTSVTSGKVRGLQTATGTSTAMIIHLLIAAPGLSWLVTQLSAGFHWLKWIGIAYLVFLAVTGLVALRKHGTARVSAAGSFRRGFWIALSNPKTILFFCAFAPQFINSTDGYYGQIALLSVTFWLLVVIRDTGYALLAHTITSFIKSRNVTDGQPDAGEV